MAGRDLVPCLPSHIWEAIIGRAATFGVGWSDPSRIKTMCAISQVCRHFHELTEKRMARLRLMRIRSAFDDLRQEPKAITLYRISIDRGASDEVSWHFHYPNPKTGSTGGLQRFTMSRQGTHIEPTWQLMSHLIWSSDPLVIDIEMWDGVTHPNLDAIRYCLAKIGFD